MSILLKRIVFIIACISVQLYAYGTHNRAGEITYEQIDQLTIRATITTYTKTSSQGADRDTVEIFWGDGTSEFVWRTNGSGDPQPNDVKINYYTAEHTYPGRGTYTLAMRDPNRVINILNITNSVNIPFFIQTQFTLLNTQFQGVNNSAILLQAPIDFACAGQRFIHNPNAFDVDGDSLSYELVTPFQERNVEVPEYFPVDQIRPVGDNNIATLDPLTGDFIWDAPQTQGDYNITIKINEYREGVFINSIIRDMQIFVRACDNRPPEIESIDEICVVAGEVVEFDVITSDVDEGQLVSLTATGGPFIANENMASLTPNDQFSESPSTSTFKWQTTCNDIAAEPYQIVFRVVDNFFDTTGLATLKTVKIKVVGPPPIDLIGESQRDQIKLDWESPYDCEITDDEYFRGFSVWRKINSNSFDIDTCMAGLEGQGYEKIIFLTNEKEGNRYVAFDDNVEKGATYCYRVLAEFAKLTETGNPYNRVQSLTSNEVCVVLSRDVPTLVEVSVKETSALNGIIQVSWVKPLANDLDTLQNPGPYIYQLQRAEGLSGTNFVNVDGAIFESFNFNSPIDTSFADTGLNTQDLVYKYRVVFFASGINNPLSTSDDASSVRLTTAPTDEAISLSWQFQVPWNNYEYIVHRKNDQTSNFDSIATVQGLSYIDTGLVNDQEYCYKITTIGSYNITGLPEPLFNDSQESCGIARDLEPPCTPFLVVTSVCDQADVAVAFDDLENVLEWSLLTSDCPPADDLAGFNIYYALDELADLQLIDTINDTEVNSFNHKPDSGISGCYAISSFDLLGNESELSSRLCLVNCPAYDLPNVFTPNGDSTHDTFTPRNNRFIESIELEVYNRWGQLVFETSDPQINWDGTNFAGKDLADGVYYYTCQVFEEGGIVRDPLKGNIHILRSR